MISYGEDVEVLLKKLVAAVFINNKGSYISKIYLTNYRLVIKNQKDQIIRISYSHIHQISIENQNKICIKCNKPMRFFDGEEYTRVFFYGLKKKEGDGLTRLTDPKWAVYWKNCINNRVKEYHKNLDNKKKNVKFSDKEPDFIEGVRRETTGLGKFEIVKTREVLNIWIDGFVFPSCKVYTTLKQVVIKLGQDDFINIPYSVISNYSKERNNKFCIIFSFPQTIKGFENKILKICLENDQESEDKYYEKISWKWMDGWIEILKQVILQFQEN